MTVRTPDPEDADAAIQAASDVIESEQANIMIEIEFTKAARVGTMLVLWRKMMIDGQFTEEWVERACTNIFWKFFPPSMEVEVISDGGDND